MLESLFRKVAALKVCNSVKKRLQRRYFLAKFANFLSTLFLQNSFSGNFWGSTRIFKEVPEQKLVRLSAINTTNKNKKVFAAAKFQKQPTLKGVKRRPATLLLERVSSIAKFLKRTLRSEIIFDNWKPFKNDEKCFLFPFKSSLRSQDIYIFVMSFWSCRKNGSIRKRRLISKSMASQSG